MTERGELKFKQRWYHTTSDTATAFGVGIAAALGWFASMQVIYLILRYIVHGTIRRPRKVDASEKQSSPSHVNATRVDPAKFD